MLKLKFGENNVPVLDVDSRKIIRLLDKIEVEILQQDVIEHGTVKVEIRPSPAGIPEIVVSDRRIKLDVHHFFYLIDSIGKNVNTQTRKEGQKQ